MVNVLTLAVVFISIFVQACSRQDISSAFDTVTSHKRAPQESRPIPSRPSNRALYFLSVVSHRRSRFRRFADSSQTSSIDHRPDVLEDDGSGSDGFELTPVNQFIEDRLVSGDETKSPTPSIFQTENESSTPVVTSINHVQTTSPVYRFELNDSGGLAVAEPPTKEVQVTVDATFQHHHDNTTTLYADSPGGSTSIESTATVEKELPATDNPLDVVSNAEVKSKEIPELSAGSSLKASLIVVSTVIGCILICTVIIVSVRYAIKRRKSTSQWSSETNGNSNGSNTTSSI